MSWIDVGLIEQILVCGVWVVKMKFGCIVVFCIVEDEVFVILDCCLYKDGLLSEGIVYGIFVICFLYNWVFDLNIGDVQGVDEGKIDIYVICVESGCFMLDVVVMECLVV